MLKFKKKKKANGEEVTRTFLRHRRLIASKFPPAKWIEFCEICLDSGFTVSLYEARKTFSKYITVKKCGKSFKVRFSNHPPIKFREANGDCDFFVGRNNFTVTTTDDAIRAVVRHFNPNV